MFEICQPIGSVRFEIGHVSESEFPSAFVVSATFALSLFQLIHCHMSDCHLFSIQYLCISNCEHCKCFKSLDYSVPLISLPPLVSFTKKHMQCFL